MRTEKNISISSISLLGIMICLFNCTDQFHSQRSSVIQSSSIIIPKYGAIQSKNVFGLQAGTHPKLTADGHLFIVNNSTGAIIKNVAQFASSPSPTVKSGNSIGNRAPYFDPISGQGSSSTGPHDPPTYTNGLAGAFATNIPNLQKFQSNYVVPPIPSSETGVIYIGAVVGGIESVNNGNGSQQTFAGPILQWGNNGSFGGSYWTIANWYVYTDISIDGEDDDGLPTYGYSTYAFFSTVYPLLPGINITSSIVNGGTESGSGSQIYSSTFQYPGVQSIATIEEGGTLSLNNPVPLLNDVWVFMEGYQGPTTEGYLSSNSQLPPNYIAVSGITVQNTSGGYASVNWTTYNDVGTGNQTGKAQQTAGVLNSGTSGNGEIDLWFQPCPLSQPVQGLYWFNSTQTLSWAPVQNATSYQVSVMSGPLGAGFYYTTKTTSMPNFFSAIGRPLTPGSYSISISPIYSCGFGYGTSFSFNVCSNNLTAPQSLGANGWNNSSQTLSWGASTGGVTNYQVVITSPSPQGTGLFYNTSATSVANFFYTFELSKIPGNYQVLITPQYSCGNGPSLTYSFTVQ